MLLLHNMHLNCAGRQAGTYTNPIVLGWGQMIKSPIHYTLCGTKFWQRIRSKYQIKDISKSSSAVVMRDNKEGKEAIWGCCAFLQCCGEAHSPLQHQSPTGQQLPELNENPFQGRSALRLLGASRCSVIPTALEVQWGHFWVLFWVQNTLTQQPGAQRPAESLSTPWRHLSAPTGSRL